MKSGTTTHPKFKSLMRELKLPQYAVVGLLESVWMLAAQYADDGDLTRFTFAEIADYAGYDGDASEFVNALIRCRWLDQTDGSLTIHDWEEHCPHYLHERRKKRNQRSTKAPSVAAHTVHVPAMSRTVPGQSDPTQPNPTKPSPTKSNPDVVVVVEDSFSFGSFLFGDIRANANKLREILPKHQQEKFRELLWQISYVGLEIEGQSLIDRMIRTSSRQKPTHVTDYLEASIRNACADRGHNWHSLKVKAPPCPPPAKPSPPLAQQLERKLA